VRRALAALGIYALLLALWPLLRPLYAPLFRATAQLAVGVVAPCGPDGVVRFVPRTEARLEQDVPRADTLLLVERRGYTGEPSRTGASSFFHGYQPCALLLALLLGLSPGAWRRRPALWAWLGLGGFLALRCVVCARYVYSLTRIDGRPALELSAAAHQALFWSWHFLWADPLASYLVPLCLWGLLVAPARIPTPSAREPRPQATGPGG